MEIGNEISHKIRSAIKAKLVELGSYVDEELPDYIMVMVANKKSQFQMSEDLGLFLGNNTEKFTTWLHSLLQKLQSITSDTAAAVPTIKSSEKTIDKPKVKDQTTPDHGTNRTRKTSADENKTKKPDASDTQESKKESRKRKSDSDFEKAEKPAVSSETTAKSMTEVNSDADVLITASKQAVPAQESVVTVEEQSVKTVETEVVVTAPKQAAPAGTGTYDSGIQVVEDDDLSDLLLTENDELTEELEQETPVVVTTSKKNEAQKVIRISDEEVSTEPPRGTASVVMSRLSSKEISPPRSSRPRAVTSPIRQTVRRVPVRMVEPRPSELQTRKRRGPVSVIGSVTHDTDEDDGYDPRNPAVGNVASVVRVTARKSSVPPKLQANKSLLLKAMTEAEKSVETQRRVAITPIKPFMRSEGRDRERERDRDRRDRSRDRGRHSRSVSSSSSRESGHPSVRLAQSSLRQAIAQPGSSSRHSDPPVYIPTKKVQPAPRADSGDRRGIVSKSRRQEAEDRTWLDKEEDTAPPRKLIKREKGAPLVNFVIEAELDTEAVTQKPSALLPPTKIKQEPLSPPVSPAAVESAGSGREKRSGDGSAIDSRVVEYEPEMVPSPQVEEAGSESGSQGVPVLLEDMDQDELLLDPDVIELTESPPPPPVPIVIEEDLRQSMMKEKAKDKTRFVVTLDGVDSDQYEMEVTEGGRYEEMVMSGVQPSVLSQAPATAAVSVSQLKEPLTMMSPPKIQPMNINLKDSDEEGEAMEAEQTPLKQAKMMERCKFWPACVNGSACEYHHPTVHCKTFPMCKFGDKCLYIHPNCRFDSKCARPDCPFTHSSRRPVPAYQPTYRPPPPPPVIPAPRSLNPPQCKFFPACSNLSCPFFHPKPCRFGLSCKNREKGCPFYHPALPSRKQLTWAAGKTTAVPTPVSTVAAASVAK